MKKKIFITGGTGNIGLPLISKLTEAYDISAIYSGNIAPSIDNVRWIHSRLPALSDEAVKAVREADIIIHAAAIIGMFDPCCFYVNVTGTEAVIKAINPGKSTTLLFLSSIEVYGLTDKLFVDETNTPEPYTLYGASKLAAETLLISYAKSNTNFSYIILRLANVYGGRHNDMLQWLTKEATSGSFMSQLYADHELNLVHINTAMSAIFKILSNESFRNVVRYLPGTPVSMLSLSHEARLRVPLIKCIKPILTLMMRLTRKGGLYLYLSYNGNQRIFRRFSNKIYDELSIEAEYIS